MRRDETGKAMDIFQTEVIRLWYKILRRRSQVDRTTWDHISRLANQYIPKVRTIHHFEASVGPANALVHWEVSNRAGQFGTTGKKV